MSFSSPPYFNKEVYSSETTQAYNNRSYEQFIDDWWTSVVKNVHYLTKEKGYLILNMVENLYLKKI